MLKYSTLYCYIYLTQFLNQEIEALTKRKKTKSLIKPEISCGIFQDTEKLIDTMPINKKND
jgi:hypothetical protein